LERYKIEKERAKQRMILAHVSSVQLNRAELGTARDVVAFHAEGAALTFQLLP